MGGQRVKAKVSKKRTVPSVDLAYVVNGLEDELFIVNDEYTVQFANSAMLRKHTGSEKSQNGGLCYAVFEKRERPCGPPLWKCPLNKVVQSGKSTEIIHPIHFLDSDNAPVKYIRVMVYPLRNSLGNVVAVAELRRDVTAERELEHEVLRRHHHLNAISRISTATSGILDLNAILHICLDISLEAVNGEKGGIMLLDEEEIKLRYRVFHGLSPKYVEETKVTRGQGIAGMVFQTGEPILLEDASQDNRVAYPDQVVIEGLKGFACVPLKAKDKVVGVMNIASRLPGRFNQEDLYLLNSIGCQIGNTVEQARLYERLAKATERYQVLLRHALTAQEDERKRIARELHDETSQVLTSLTLTLQAAIQTVEMKGIQDNELIDSLKAAHANTVYAATEVVKLMKELRPTLLDELGLPVAIQRYAKDNLQSHGINISTEFEGTDRRFPPIVEVTLFRVAQGLMGNILEHSGAKNTYIKLKCDDDKCVMRIEDDGKGFNVDKLTQVEPSGRGAGLFTIKERIKLVGGHCNIDSLQGAGTKITVNVPLAMDVTNEEDKSIGSG
jgi:signal transduction histidine kinase